MKWTKLCGALLAAAGMMGTAFAGTCAPLSTGHAGDKSTGCAPAYQPCASKPVICRPDYRKVCSYQRSCTKQTLNGCNIGNGNHGGHGGAGGAGGSCVTAAPSHGAEMAARAERTPARAVCPPRAAPRSAGCWVAWARAGCSVACSTARRAATPGVLPPRRLAVLPPLSPRPTPAVPPPRGLAVPPPR